MSCQNIVSVLVFACCLAATAPLQAVPITIPTGLAPGEDYRLAFVTSTARDATSSVIADYNTFVNNLAQGVTELAALGTTWMAIASTAAVDARANTATDPGPDAAPTGVPIYLLNNTKLVDNYDDLWDGTIDLSLNVTEQGTLALLPPPFPVVWTGTTGAGLGFAGFTLGDAGPMTGLLGTTNPGWVQFFQFPGQEPHPFYGLSGDLTVPTAPAAIPEPGTFMLLASGMGGLLLLAWQRTRRRVRAVVSATPGAH